MLLKDLLYFENIPYSIQFDISYLGGISVKKRLQRF